MGRAHHYQGWRESAKEADGAPTALAESFVREEGTIVTAGATPMALKRGIDKAVEANLATVMHYSVLAPRATPRARQ